MNEQHKSLIYWIPKLTGISDAKVDELGLRDRIGKTIKFRAGPGPGKEFGVFVTGGDGLDLKPYDEKSQTWAEIEGGQIWVGFYNNQKPGPDDFIRETIYPGHNVEMGDGKQWKVPILYVWPNQVIPPGQCFKLESDGSVTTALRPEFIKLGEQIEEVWNSFAQRIGSVEIGKEEYIKIDIDIKRDFDLISDALAIHYRITKWEVGLLGLLDQRSIYHSLRAMLDFPTLDEMVKKNELSGLLSGGDGRPD